MLLALPAIASATDNLWTGQADVNWNNPANWSLGRVPSSPSSAPDNFDDAVINTSTGNIATIFTDTTAKPRDMKVGQGAGSNGRVDHTGGFHSTGSGNWTFIGLGGGTGTYNLADTTSPVPTTANGPYTGFDVGSGSYTTQGEYLYVGIDAGSVGTFNMNTVGTVQADRTRIGAGGTGTMNIDGGTYNSARSFQVGEAGDSRGVVNQSGGLVNVTNDWFGIGYGGGAAQDSRYTITGGELRIGTVAEIGADRGGIMNISGTGLVKMVGGGNNNGGFIIGLRTGGNGTLNLSGNGTLELGDTPNFTIGGNGGTTGRFNQTGGTVTDTAGTTPLVIGRDGGSTGRYDFSAGSATYLADSTIGAGGSGTMNISGTAALTAKNLNVNGGSGGIVNQSGGSVVANEWIAVGRSTANTGEYNLSGGTVQAAGFEVGADGPATVRVSGTGVLNAGAVEVSVRNNGNGTLAVTGGTINTTNMALGGRDAQNVGTIGVVSQSGGTVNVSNVLDLQTSNAGIGNYNLSGGVLAVDGSIDGLTGSFSFTGGKLSRSNAGTIVYNGNLTTGSRFATLDLDTDKAFDVNGIFNIATGVTFELTGLTIPAWDGNGTDTGSFLLGTVDSIVGTFDPSTTSTPGLINQPGATFISESAGEGGAFDPGFQSVYWIQESGGNVTLQYSVVPEPTALGLLGLSVFALMARRRRK